MSDTPLRDRFDAMLCGKPPVPESIRKALLEAFMAGAAAHDNIAIDAMNETNDPEELARVLDAMVVEMRNRHRCDWPDDGTRGKR